MQQLPKGYYAVQSDFENAPKDSFIYKGVTYAVTEGVNLFGSLADAAQKAEEIPNEIIEGLERKSFDTPVLLFSEGRHVIDKFVFERSLTLLGQWAGVSPNTPAENAADLPTLTEGRGENESKLFGSFWFGNMRVASEQVEKIEIDGFTQRQARFQDVRRKTGNYVLRFCNNIVKGPCGRTLYSFASPLEGEDVNRDILYQNIRVMDYDDFGYGESFVHLNARRAVFDGFCYADGNLSFGLTPFSRTVVNSDVNGTPCEYMIRNSHFQNVASFNFLATVCAEKGSVSLAVENSSFVNVTPENGAVLHPQLPGDNSSLTVKGCRFVDTRGNTSPAILVRGEGKQVKICDSTFEGFSAEWETEIIRTEAPVFIENRETDWLCTEGTEDPHTVVGNANRDLAALDKMYEGRKAYRGDLHVHTKCGGTSDGIFEMSKWPEQMDEKGVDFAAIVDHKQMRGFFLPEWDETRFLYGTEPGMSITEGLRACRHGQNSIHYNMIFPHKYGLAMLLANVPEHKFNGDELTGSFSYFKVPYERFLEIAKKVQDLGGIMVHAHPTIMLCSNDPMDFYLGEHTFIETIYDTVYSYATRCAYKLWTDLLALGKRVYASSGSDSHSYVMNTALATFYTKEKHHSAFFEKMHAADFNPGAVGMQMCIDEHPMGSEIEYREGMKLSLRIQDFFAHEWRADTVYALRIFTDKGIAYYSEFNGKCPQEVQLEVQKRGFYRADIYDMTHDCVVALTNPIWLD
ncbi:MAG: hypothetical protein IJZ80_09295 [Clostridia bacterium]|nr:hypothetical protein [Clostridia bacterium]